MLVRKFIILVVCSMSLSAWAVEVAPATTDDMNNFESTIEREQAASESTATSTQTTTEESKKKAKKANFGQIVSAKAKEQKNLTAEQRKEMGSWVSAQKRQNSAEAKAGVSSADTRQGAAGAGKGNASDKSKGKK